MSHCSALRYINMLGENFGKKVIEWLQQDQGLIKRAGDNIDINQSARNQRKDNHGKSHHWFLAMAFKNPVPSSHLPNDNPICDLKDTPLSEFLLNNQEQKKLKEDFCTIILRVLCSQLEFLKPFQKYVAKHIPHEYSAMFQQKGEAVNLGLVFQNENSSEDRNSVV